MPKTLLRYVPRNQDSVKNERKDVALPMRRESRSKKSYWDKRGRNRQEVSRKMIPPHERPVVAELSRGGGGGGGGVKGFEYVLSAHVFREIEGEHSPIGLMSRGKNWCFNL